MGWRVLPAVLRLGNGVLELEQGSHRNVCFQLDKGTEGHAARTGSFSWRPQENNTQKNVAPAASKWPKRDLKRISMSLWVSGGSRKERESEREGVR